eukprot:15441517-Alexandrium_andersonii.AAC.1
MDVDGEEEEPDDLPANYRAVDLTEPSAPYIGDPMAPVGELGLSADPARCGCRCGGTITLAATGEAVECEALCCLPRGHD